MQKIADITGIFTNDFGDRRHVMGGFRVYFDGDQFSTVNSHRSRVNLDDSLLDYGYKMHGTSFRKISFRYPIIEKV